MTNIITNPHRFRVELWRDAEHVGTFWCDTKTELQELYITFNADNETVRHADSLDARSEKPTSVYDGMTDEQKKEAHAIQVRRMMADGA